MFQQKCLAKLLQKNQNKSMENQAKQIEGFLKETYIEALKALLANFLEKTFAGACGVILDEVVR